MTLQSEISAAVTAFRQIHMREPNESERASLIAAAEDICGIQTRTVESIPWGDAMAYRSRLPEIKARPADLRGIR